MYVKTINFLFNISKIFFACFRVAYHVYHAIIFPRLVGIVSLRDAFGSLHPFRAPLAQWEEPPRPAQGFGGPQGELYKWT
jgi:hypothetical protein